MGEGQFIHIDDNEETLYSHYKDGEIEQYFSKFEIIYKEKRIIQRKINDEQYTSAYYDYILLKR